MAKSVCRQPTAPCVHQPPMLGDEARLVLDGVEVGALGQFQTGKTISLWSLLCVKHYSHFENVSNNVTVSICDLD